MTASASMLADAIRQAGLTKAPAALGMTKVEFATALVDALSARPEALRSGATPRTDALSLKEYVGSKDFWLHYIDMLDHARELERELAEARFRPIGDNHHNAQACPYCTPSPLGQKP